MDKSQKGFSLLESLISLFLFLLIVLFSLNCFLNVKEHFAMLKETETSNTAVYAALERMRKDLADAGRGLIEAMKLQVLEGLSIELERLVVLSKDVELVLGGDIVSGQQLLPVVDAQKIKKGQLISIVNPLGGEVHSVMSADQNNVVIDSPLLADYSMETTQVLLLRRISLFLDDAQGVIRRKVNASSAQPLLEDAASFTFEYIKDANLVRLDLTLKCNEEKRYETTVFPKNTAMASITSEK